MGLDTVEVFKQKVVEATVAAYLTEKPTTPTYSVEVNGQDVSLKPGTPVTSELDMVLIRAIAKGVASVVLEEFASAEVVFPPPGLKAIVPPGITGEVQGKGRVV